ncbi:MAG: cupredoxin domain-containing protein [Actinomycetota bacterium]
MLALAAALVLAACGGDGGGGTGSNGDAQTSEQAEEESSGTIKVAGEDANDHGTKDVAGAREAEVELDDFYFEPTVLTGAAGQKLTLTLANEGDATHNFSLEAQGIDEDIDPGAEAEVEVTFPDSGELLFMCKFHTGQGMNGGLEAS